MSEVESNVAESSTANLPKIRVKKASVICQFLDLEDVSAQHCKDDTDTTLFLTRLIEHERYMDAIRFLALALPKREAVWWACLCARSTCDPKSLNDIQALNAAEEWVYKPTEQARQKCGPLAESTQFKTAAGWTAMAAFWSGGSMTPPNTPKVPPAEELCGKAVGGAVLLSAATEKEVKNIDEKYKRFIVQGIDIAKGGKGTL